LKTKTGIRFLTAAFASAALAAVLAAPASALELKTGDILVANPNANDVGDIVKVDPKTGQQTALSDDSSPGTDYFAGAYDLVLDRFGRLFVVDYTREGGGDGQLIRVDPATGAQTVLSTAGAFVEPIGLALAPSGKLLVADDEAFADLAGGVIEINPTTGAQRVISSNALSSLDLFDDPYDIAVNRTGRILVADLSGAVIGVTPAGQQSLVSDNAKSPADLFNSPDGVIFDRGGKNAIAVDDDLPGLIGVDTATGAQSLISGDASPGPDLFEDPHRAVFDLGGKLIVADYDFDNNKGGILRVDRATGAQALVSDSSTSTLDLFTDPTAAIVVPPKCAGQYPTIYGTPKKDKLVGTRFPDVIAGLAGKDVIKGLGAKDRLCGGKGRDRLIGGKGRDKLRGGPGRDFQRQ
jgi:DNA-binding beta-propeller fold protein YncE